MDSAQPPSTRPTALDWCFRVVGFLALVAVGFTLPRFPVLELDSSWRQAIGKFFVEGRQFGSEVIFSYGPLGWTMSRTYWGGQWHSLIGWYAVQAVMMAGLVYWHAYRLQGYRRMFFFIFFFLFGLTYQDAVQQIAMILAGLELIRRCGSPWRWSSVLLLVILVFLSLVKFTNLMLGFFLVLLAGALELWQRRHYSSLRVPALFGVLFLLGWVLCGQHLGGLFTFMRSSWEISSGYQDAMGLACPPNQLYFGLAVAALMIAYLLLNWATHPDRVRGLVLMLAGAAYLYLNWKHGFIRADGHQIGFYYAVLTILTGAPLLLEDSTRLRLWKNTLAVSAAVLSIVSLELVLPGLVRGVLAATQDNVDKSISFALGKANTRELFDAKLKAEQEAIDLGITKNAVKNATLDVLGFEQAVALYNKFNYQPRPILQSYSVYTPYLSRMNYEHYLSDKAPEFALLKLQVIDERLLMMDDAHVLRVLTQRYEYQFTEQGFSLWKRKPGPYSAASDTPKPLRDVAAKLGEKIDLAELANQHVWVEIDYQYSLLGKLRRFLFRPALVQLRITDQAGVDSVYRLPQPIGKTGFMLNPLVNDLAEFMRAAGGQPVRWASAITVETAAADRRFVREKIKVAFSAMPPSEAGKDFFTRIDKAKFHMFVDAPVSFQAQTPPNEDWIDKRRVMVLHAPSQMVFQVPATATTLRGLYGFVAGAYANESGHTNGAEFIIEWSDGGEPVILHQRYLAPAVKANDRGLQSFAVTLPKSSGKVTFIIKPGLENEYSYDWTAWTGIEFK